MEDKKNTKSTKRDKRKALKVILSYSLWLATMFVVSQLLLAGVVYLAKALGVDLDSLNNNLLVVSLGAITYIIMLVLTLGLPKWIYGKATSWEELGVNRWLTWKDIGLAVGAMVVYFIFSYILISIAMRFLPWFDLDQVQETGIVAPQRGIELVLVFILFVVAAPFAEELLFRGYLFGKLRANKIPFWLTAIIVSILFGAAHGQWNVGVDTFALSMVMCLAREVSGALWPTVLMHMMKNGIAFYFLFVNPTMIQNLMS